MLRSGYALRHADGGTGFRHGIRSAFGCADGRLGAQRQLPANVIPVFGYKNHVAIDRAYGFICRAAVTDAACHDGSVLRHLVTSDNRAASVWTDTAYR